MSFEDTIRQIIREENEKHLEDIKVLLNSHVPSQDVPRMLKPQEAAEIIGVGYNKIYEIIHKSNINGFPVIREGRKNLIPYHALMNWINQQANQAI